MITIVVSSPKNAVVGYLLVGCVEQVKGWALIERKTDHLFQTLSDNDPTRVAGLRRLN